MARKEAQPWGQSESGYDYNFVTPPPDRLVCKICQFPCCEAQLTDCCGHVYCQPCVEKVKRVADRGEHLCPMCRKANFNTFAHREADRTIKELLIYCPNDKEGRGKCSWTGPLADVGKHLQDCKVECRRCGVSLGHHAMRRHLATLSCRCKHCHSKRQCCCQLITCPNKCGEDVLKDEMHEHRKLCPFEVVECEHHCGVRLTRCEIEEHCKTCERRLVQLTYNENLKNIYEEIKSNANKISEAKDIMKDEIDRLKQSVTDIEQITRNCYNRNENILGCNSSILLLILVLIISLTVMMTQTQTNLETISIDKNKASKQINPRGSHTNNVENSWLLKYEELKRNAYLPVILKMADFTEKKKNKKSWYSDSFFVFKDGCQMCLRVDASGHTDQKDTFISVYLYLKDLHDITVEHNSQCKWPLKGEFSVELLNHHTDSLHQHQKLMIVSNPGSRRFDLVNTNLMFSGLGCHNFISYKILSESGHIYLGNDTLYFRVLYEDKPTNIIRKHNFVDIFLNYCIKIITEHLFFPCLTLGIVDFIFEATLPWVTNDIMEIVVEILVLLVPVVIGVIAIGNLLGGILWFMAFNLASQFRLQVFPDQEKHAYICMFLTLLAAKILLMDLLQVQLWKNISWGIFNM